MNGDVIYFFETNSLIFFGNKNNIKSLSLICLFHPEFTSIETIFITLSSIILKQLQKTSAIHKCHKINLIMKQNIF